MQHWNSLATSSSHGLRPQILGLLTRREFAASSRCLAQRLWTAEEDGKLAELTKQGLSNPRIAQQLGRSVYGIWTRKAKLLKPTQISSGKRWTPHEDAIIRSMRKNGLTTAQMAEFLPGRSINAIELHWKNSLSQDAHEETAGSRPRAKRFRLDAQKVAHMRAYEGKSFAEIAATFGCTRNYMTLFWCKHARKLVPDEILSTLRRKPGWTAEMDQRLLELIGKGVKSQQLDVHFPGKSWQAIAIRRLRLQGQDKKHTRLSRVEAAAVRKALEPVMEGTSTMEEVARAFPEFSKIQIDRQARALRILSKADPSDL